MANKIFLGVAMIFLALVSAGNENTQSGKLLDDIISSHIEALGGSTKLESVEAMELRGKFTGFSAVNDFYLLKTRNGGFYMDYYLGKNRVLEGSDGSNFWTIDPWQGFDFPRRVNTAERHVMMQKSELITPFYGWKEKGFSVELLDDEMIDGMKMYVMSLKRPGMTPEKWYIYAETYLVYKSVTRWVDFATPADAEIFYDDYRDVYGVIVPHYIENTYRTRHTVTEIDEIVMNPVVDNAIFSMPACPHMEKLAMMARTWNVQVEYMTRGGIWQVFDEVLCCFDFRPGNLLQGTIFYEVTFPVVTTYSINYSRRNQNYQLMVYDEFYSTAVLYEGTFTDDILVFNHPDIEQDQPVMQYTFRFNDNDRIVMLRKQSADKGKTWQDVERLTLLTSQ